MSAAEEHLRKVLLAMAGSDARPRPDQLAAVGALVDDHARVLVVQATGWGKSAVYWAATSARRAAGFGATLVVSPLLALMRDQVGAATAAGLHAATVNSTNPDDWDAIFADATAGRLDVLLVSPERLANPRFAGLLPTLVGSAGLIVIDEAHCISDWGFDFRPDYQRLARVLVGVGADTPVLATTATANQRVTDDVAGQLGTGTLTFRGSLARSSLSLAVVPGLGAVERYAWVADALTTTAGSGIIYTLTIAESERLAAYLDSCGFAVAAYHGGLESEARERIEDQLRANELKAVVATSALGMGYDKPDLAFCIHVGSPSSPVAYYQQVGRAGRALDNAVAVLLPAESDERIWQYFATAGVPDPDRVEQILSALTDGSQSLAGLETMTTIRRGRLEGLLKILSVEGVVARNGTQWIRTDQPWVYDHERWDALAAVRAREADLMRAFAAGAGCLMRFLQTALDDPDPIDCGRCSVCTGVLPPPGATPTPERIVSAQTFVRGLDVIIEPRKLWPGGTAKRGKIVGCSEGRALAFADDPGWTTELRAMFSGHDYPAPQAVLDGLVGVLGRWRRVWGGRPIAVVPCPSLGHPRLIHSVCEHLANVGKLAFVDALGLSGTAVGPDAASGAKVGSLLAGMALRPGVDLPCGPILLVDAIYRSGWTATVAASLLRGAGATVVLPLAIHRVP